MKVMFHTCGAISEIIADLIECGVDVIDPVQVSATGMEPQALAHKFKNRISFHGGINTQFLLSFGKPEEVREQVSHTIDALGPLGYIVAPDQGLIGNVPLANIEAMYEAIRNYPLAC